MVFASLLFATMGVCVKLASSDYDAGEIVLYRSLVGVVIMIGIAHWRGQSLRTKVPLMHFKRSLAGVAALSLWFYSMGKLPLATAMTLNYMSSVWMALFLIGGAIVLGTARIDARLVAVVVLGFVGVALVLQPTLDHDQLWHGLAGLASGMLAAPAYLQVTAMGRAGEPETRIVFYFSVGGVIAGTLTVLAAGGLHAHSLKGLALLLAVGLLATSAQLMMTRAYSIGKTLVNASLQYLGIVFSFVYGAWLFDTVLSVSALTGIGLIVFAGLAATLLRTRNAPLDKQASIGKT